MTQINDLSVLKYGVCGEFGWVGFLVRVCCLYKTNPNPRKSICCGKKWPKCYFLIFLGLGWPRVGELVDFMIIFTYMSNYE